MSDALFVMTRSGIVSSDGKGIELRGKMEVIPSGPPGSLMDFIVSISSSQLCPGSKSRIHAACLVLLASRLTDLHDGF
jgi:hypothetical protein